MPPKRKSPDKSITRALLAAVKKGDVGGVSTLIATEVQPEGTTTSAMQKSCLAPNAIALLGAFGLHNPPPHEFPLDTILDLFLYACRHGADPSTVVFIVQSMCPLMQHSKVYPEWWEGMSAAIQRKNVVLVGCISKALGDFLDDAPDKFLTKVIESADKEFALEVVNAPAVQALLLDIEKTFEPAVAAAPGRRRRGRSSRKCSPRSWVTAAFKNGDMCQVVAMIYQLCPLVVGESVFLYSYNNFTTTRTRANWAPIMERYAVFNDKIKEFLDAVHAGDVQAVAAKLEEASILVNARDANGVPALKLSSTSPNAPALLACFRQHLHKHDRGKINSPATVYCHVCQNGGDSATLAFLMDWLGECASRSSDALWDGVKQALTKQHLPMFTHLLQVGRSTGAMDFNKLTWLVVKSKVHDFPLAMFESEPMQEYLSTLDPLDYDEEVTIWVAFGVHRNLPQLVECLDTWAPQSTRKTMFVHCVHPGRHWRTWIKFRWRHESDVKWSRARDSHLVVCRRLPGLRVLGSRVASFVAEDFVPNDEYYALFPGRFDLLTRIRDLVTVVHCEYFRSKSPS